MRLRVNWVSVLVGSSIQLASWHIQQGPHKLYAIALPLCRHGRQPRQPRAPAERQQQRLHLVICMLRYCYCFYSCLRFTLLGYSLI
jgi:hypothetical protein